MGTYRKEWDCCDSVTETQGWEPESCPFCTPNAVTIQKEEHEKLIDDSMKLNSLINGGVDNWSWYWEALEEYRQWKGEEDE